GASAGIDVWLRKDNGLVLREIAYQTDSGGARQVAQTHVVTYRTVDTASTPPSDCLTPSIPSDWMQSTSRILTPQTAAAMHDLDLYWLGTDYPGFVLINL